LVISLSAGCAKGVVTRPGTLHVGIILTPPRYQWGGEVNSRASKMRLIFKFATPFFDHYLRVWDFEASKRPDVIVSISKFVQSKVQKTYRHDSVVIYPGIDFDFWGVEERQVVKRDDYYLVVSRLYDYKRIDLAIEACNKLGRKLVIIGQGPDEKYLRKIAGHRITFLGFGSDDGVKQHMQKCKAFLFPGVEDFGLTPVESMACGAPVIAYNKGGLVETVLDYETGLFFDEQNSESLRKAIVEFESIKFDRGRIMKRALLFSEARFIKSFEKMVDNEI
ncbi:MAG: glycosyltransferase, partial [Patescibacteria group bacterium]|nr:glycosyltransferase [Patescibacteria group bacterium]